MLYLPVINAPVSSKCGKLFTDRGLSEKIDTVFCFGIRTLLLRID